MKDRIQRIDYIRKRLEQAKKDQKQTHTIKNWRGKNILILPYIQVDVDYLLYRIENSRTEIQQLAYLRTNSMLSKAIFDDPESSDAQKHQEIILEHINSEAGKDFFNDLEHRGQSDPAIITYDGYLVNGNRRTAALKSLGTRYIDCVVLPEDATPKDVYELEQELQISEDFRLNYHWINELRNIARGVRDKRYNYEITEIAKRLRIKDGDVKAKLRMLDLVDAFLIWKGLQEQYDYPKLDEAEQIFIQLEKAIKRYDKDDQKREELQNAVFNLIEEKPSKGRLYSYVMDLIKNFDQVFERLSPAPVDKENKDEDKTDGTLIDLISRLEDPEASFRVFSNPGKAIDISTSIVEAIRDIKAANKEKENNEAVYEAVSEALRELTGLTIEDDTSKKESIKSKLHQIISISQELLKGIGETDDK